MEYDGSSVHVSPRRRPSPTPGMEPSTKIALGIIGAAVLLLVGSIAYREFERQREIAEAQAIMQYGLQSLQQGSAEYQQALAAANARAAAQSAYQQQQAAIERARYYLADNQRCVGGAVVQVDGNSYTQIGSIAQPVHCAGNVADRPLR